MKLVKNLKFMIMVLIISVSQAQSIDKTFIAGKVIFVDGNIVKIEVRQSTSIQIGNQVNLYHKTAFGDKIQYGKWIVSYIDKKRIKAKPIAVITEPIVGLLAEIQVVSQTIDIDTKRNHINPWSEDNRNNKDTAIDSQQYVDKARKMAKDLYSNSKNYSKSKIKNLQNKTIENIQNAIFLDNSEAYYLLAFIVYEDGFGNIKKDLKKMVDNLTLSAEKGYVEAQYILGEMYKDGDEVVKDREQAIYWLKKAASQGHKDAELELSMIEKKKLEEQPYNKSNINDLYDLLDQ